MKLVRFAKLIQWSSLKIKFNLKIDTSTRIKKLNGKISLSKSRNLNFRLAKIKDSKMKEYGEDLQRPRLISIMIIYTKLAILSW